MLLEEMKWEGPETLDKVVVFGIEPLKFLLDQFCEYCVWQDNDSGYLGYHTLFDEKVNRLENTLNRFAEEMKHQAAGPENDAKESQPKTEEDEFMKKHMQLVIEIIGLDHEQRVLVHKDLIKIIKKAKALKPEESEA